MKHLIAICLIWGFARLATANPLRLAIEARMDIYGEEAVGAIASGRVTGGSIQRMSWMSEPERSRAYLALWPIREFAWREISCSFVPASNGWVYIDLLGPWEWCAPSNAIYRQEVLWDSVSVTGATLTNGGFEVVINGVPVGWGNPWGGPVVIEQGPDPVDGTNVVNTWHDRRVRTALWVTGGVPVVIRAHARARVPNGWPLNSRIMTTETPAHYAARRFMRGINFGNFLEAPPGQDWGGGPILDADLDQVRLEGFDHVRLPVRWSAHTGPGPAYAISNAFLQRVDAVVTGLLARGIGVLLDVHHFEEFSNNPTAWTNKLYAIWMQLASHYSNASDRLAFEILNEPHDPATTEFMSDVYSYLVARLREAGCQRTIFVSPGNWSRISELPRLRLPNNDSNIVVTVHIYEPMLFTHQAASWMGDAFATTNIVYPGPPTNLVTVHPNAAQYEWVVEWINAYNTEPRSSNPCSSNAFEWALRMAKEWSDHYGRPLHVGEYGAYVIADRASRARYYREMREVMDRLGLGWASWDWKAGFPYWDRGADAPVEGLREALFPAPVLSITAQLLEIKSELAIGKRIKIEQSPLQTPWAWAAVATQSLAQPVFTWPIPADLDGAVFRIGWLKLEAP